MGTVLWPLEVTVLGTFLSDRVNLRDYLIPNFHFVLPKIDYDGRMETSIHTRAIWI